MTTAKIFLTATLAFAFSLALRSQPMEPPVPGKIGLSLSSSAAGSSDGKLKAGNTTYDGVAITNYSWALNQRIGLGGIRHLTIGLDYDLTKIEGKESSPLPLPNQLQSLGASVRYLHPINQQWLMSTSVGAGSQVTDSGLLSDGWGMRASAVGIYNRSRQLTFMFGLAYNSLSQDLKLVPVFGCDWRPTEKWSFALGFPKTGVTYKLNKQISLGLAASGSGGAFYVKDDPLTGTAPRSLADSKLQYVEVRVGIQCDWKINQTIRVSGTIGQVLYRQFKYIDRDYKLKAHGTVPFLSLAGNIAL